MCKKWHVETPGKCSYGDKCQFIHEKADSSFDPRSMEISENLGCNYTMNTQQIIAYAQNSAASKFISAVPEYESTAEPESAMDE
jgi:hypothetical protein